MRRLIVVTVLTSMLAFALGTVGASAASAASMPAEGVFENCPVDTAMQNCVQRLAVMRQGGVNVVVFPANGGSPSSLSAYAAAAHWLGMSVMWETSNPGWWEDAATSTSVATYYPEFVTACGCDQNGPVLAYMIHFLGSLPGTYGYYAADDSMLAPGDGPGVTSYVAQIKQQDPSATVMIGSSSESMTNTYERSADLIGSEIYPVTTSSLMPVTDNAGMWASVAQTASDSQRFANQASKQSAFILQAFTWGDNLSDGEAIGVCSPTDSTASCYTQLRYPSAAEQLQLRNEVLAHAHPKLILWWSFQGTYGQAGDDTYSIYPTGGVAASRWAGLSAAIHAPAPGSTPHKTSTRAPLARASSVRHSKRSTKNHGKRRRGHKPARHHTGKRHRRIFMAHAAHAQ